MFEMTLHALIPHLWLLQRGQCPFSERVGRACRYPSLKHILCDPSQKSTLYEHPA